MATRAHGFRASGNLSAAEIQDSRGAQVVINLKLLLLQESLLAAAAGDHIDFGLSDTLRWLQRML